MTHFTGAVRRCFIPLALLWLAATWGCMSDPGTTSVLRVRLAETPPSDPSITSMVVVIDRLAVHEAGGAWTDMNMSPTPIDLLAQKIGVPTTVAQQPVRPARYDRLRLGVSSVQALRDGTNVSVDVPADATYELALAQDLVAAPRAVADLTVSFDPAQSLQPTGSGGLTMAPVVTIDIFPAAADGTAQLIPASTGGFLALASGASVEIPPGALPADTTVWLTQDARSQVGGTLVGPSYHLYPEGLAFRVPVRVTVPYDPRHVPTWATEGSLFLTWDWAVVEGSSIDTAKHMIAGDVLGTGRLQASAPEQEVVQQGIRMFIGGTDDDHYVLAIIDTWDPTLQLRGVEASPLPGNGWPGSTVPWSDGQTYQLKSLAEQTAGRSLVAINAAKYAKRPWTLGYEYANTTCSNDKWRRFGSNVGDGDAGFRENKIAIPAMPSPVMPVTIAPYAHASDIIPLDLRFNVIGSSTSISWDGGFQSSSETAYTIPKTTVCALDSFDARSAAGIDTTSRYLYLYSNNGGDDLFDELFSKCSLNDRPGKSLYDIYNLLRRKRVVWGKTIQLLHAIQFDSGHSVTMQSKDQTLVTSASAPIQGWSVISGLAVMPTPRTPVINAPSTANVDAAVTTNITAGTDLFGAPVRVKCSSPGSSYDAVPFDSGLVPSGSTVPATFSWSASGAKTISCTTLDVLDAISLPATATITVGGGSTGGCPDFTASGVPTSAGIWLGSPYPGMGTVSASSPLTAVTLAVTSIGGLNDTTTTTAPNATSFNLSNLTVPASLLSTAGTYTIGVWARTSSCGTAVMLQSYPLVVSTSVTSMSPLSAATGALATFTISGNGLLSTLQLNLPNCTGMTSTGGSSTSRTFTCTPQQAGPVTAQVLDQPGGNVLQTFNVTFTTTGSCPDATVSGLPSSPSAWLGSPYTPTGTVTASSPLTTVTLAVTSPAGPSDNSTTTSPNTTSFNLSNLTIPVSLLSTTGVYTIGVWAKTTGCSTAALIGSFQITVATLVSSLSPLSAVVGTPTTFTVTGSGLPSNLQLFIPNCTVSTSTTGSSTSRSLTCTPLQAGTYTAQVKDAPGGNLLKTFTVTFAGGTCPDATVSGLPSSPSIWLGSSYTASGTVTASSPLTTVTLAVTNPAGTSDNSTTTSPNTTSFNLSNLTIPASLLGATGVYTVGVWVKTAGCSTAALLGSFQLTVSTLVSSLSPLSALVGSSTTFTVSGSGLPSNLQLFIPNCTVSTSTTGSSTSRWLTCTPLQAGAYTAQVKDAPGGNLLNTFTVTFTGVTCPDSSVSGLPSNPSIWLGSSYTPTGTVTASSPLTTVTLAVTNPAGTSDNSTTTSPNTTSFNLSNLTIPASLLGTTGVYTVGVWTKTAGCSTAALRGSFQLTVSTLVSSLTPLSAKVNVATTFTVSGSGLPSTLQLFIPNCTYSTSTSGTSTSRWLTCTPLQAGTYTAQVKDAAGGTLLKTFSVTLNP